MDLLVGSQANTMSVIQSQKLSAKQVGKQSQDACLIAAVLGSVSMMMAGNVMGAKAVEQPVARNLTCVLATGHVCVVLESFVHASLYGPLIRHAAFVHCTDSVCSPAKVCAAVAVPVVVPADLLGELTLLCSPMFSILAFSWSTSRAARTYSFFILSGAA